MNNRHFLRLLAVIAAILIAQQASAIVVPRANTDTFEIKSPVDKSKCVDCAQNKNGYQLRMWECNGTPNQQFRYTNGQIISVQSGLCVDVDQNNPHDWAKVQMYDCNGTGAQQWELKQSGGHYGVFLKGTNYVLNDLYRDTSQGALVGLYTIADGDLASLWDIRKFFFLLFIVDFSKIYSYIQFTDATMVETIGQTVARNRTLFAVLVVSSDVEANKDLRKDRAMESVIPNAKIAISLSSVRDAVINDCGYFIKRNETVAELKKGIKTEKKNDLAAIDANNLLVRVYYSGSKTSSVKMSSKTKKTLVLYLSGKKLR
ncbi:hypothetical protein HK098_005323 [Nowakowskiella sp. JEL0407]|nr:hypothetical protein HK098_005323 [Nowakowskiella sp. JEL0407]